MTVLLTVRRCDGDTLENVYHVSQVLLRDGVYQIHTREGALIEYGATPIHTTWVIHLNVTPD